MQDVIHIEAPVEHVWAFYCDPTLVAWVGVGSRSVAPMTVWALRIAR